MIDMYYDHPLQIFSSTRILITRASRDGSAMVVPKSNETSSKNIYRQRCNLYTIFRVHFSDFLSARPVARSM